MVRELTSSPSLSSLGRGGDGDMVMKPAWLDALMAETFFETCGSHQNRRKNEKNIFCLDCCQSFCPHCLPSHHSHPLLQVRKYVYQYVVRLDDLEKLIDCSKIQPYTINNAKVVFLNERSYSKSSKDPVDYCFTCHRNLQHPYNFCSLSCKVDHMVYRGQDLSNIIYRSQFQCLQMDDQITPNSILEEDPLQFLGSSCSNDGMGNSGILQQFPHTANNKRSGFLRGMMLSLSNRRKGAPHRSPLS